MGAYMKTIIFKGYSEDDVVWAIGKTYGSGETETKFICPIEPTKEIIEEYERRKDVHCNTRKKEWISCWNAIHKKKAD